MWHISPPATCTPPVPIPQTVSSRSNVLVVLLALQSLSSTVLQSYEGLIAKHTIIVMFLTMLVGAGGNAGSQATVNVISGLSTGRFGLHSFKAILKQVDRPQTLTHEPLLSNPSKWSR